MADPDDDKVDPATRRALLIYERQVEAIREYGRIINQVHDVADRINNLAMEHLNAEQQDVIYDIIGGLEDYFVEIADTKAAWRERQPWGKLETPHAKTNKRCKKC